MEEKCSFRKTMSVDAWECERQARRDGYKCIVGIDEAGRGPLAGPVVAAAVILPDGWNLDGLKDSKAMTPPSRERAYSRIINEAIAVGVGIIGPDIIDEINILRATHLAMRTALADLNFDFDFILVDGLPVPDLPKPSRAIVKGDSKSASIMAASVVAKVTRDHIMEELDKHYPEYGFASHKGYCSREHVRALKMYGPSLVHRKSFSPVSEIIAQCSLPGLD